MSAIPSQIRISFKSGPDPRDAEPLPELPYGGPEVNPAPAAPDERIIPLAEVVEVVLRRRLRYEDDDVFRVLHVPVEVEQVFEHAPAVDDDADGARVVRPDPGPVPVRLRFRQCDAHEELDPGLCRGRTREHRPRFESEECAVVLTNVDLETRHRVVEAHAVMDDNFRIHAGRYVCSGYNPHESFPAGPGLTGFRRPCPDRKRKPYPSPGRELLAGGRPMEIPQSIFDRMERSMADREIAPVGEGLTGRGWNIPRPCLDVALKNLSRWITPPPPEGAGSD